MLNDPYILVSAFMLGLLGSGHCIGMCGGLSSALGLNTQPLKKNQTTSGPLIDKHILAYNIGRITSYTLAGLIIGSLGFLLSQQLSALIILRYMAAIMLILMGLYLGKWFNGIIYAEKLGKYLWPFIQPLSARFIPIRSTKDALFVGMIWGWLPCGLVYSALIWASLESSVTGSGLIMLCFGLGTLPAMLATGMFAQQLNHFIKRPWFRQVSGSLMISFGIWSLPIIQKLLIDTSI